ncbi:hypothetical protein MFUR16E_20420 [Methylobacterium fujisawaense]|uniref:hypothetical protein n=1 Tax=Methylobacterium fujisawaense TaxID=107400 RepID=UPI002F344B59
MRRANRLPNATRPHALAAAILAFLALLPGLAQAYDPAQAPRYGSQNIYQLDVNGLVVHGPGSTGPVDGMSVTPGANAISRTLAQKLGERTSLNDYIKPFDLGDYAFAIERAAANGVKEIHATKDQLRYTFKHTANLPNAEMRLICDGNYQVELNLAGNNDYLIVAGNPTTHSYHFHVIGCLITKDQASTQGAVFKIQNLNFWSIDNVRVYSANKFWRGLELISASSGVSRDVVIDSVQERAAYINGGPAAFGTPNGGVVDNIFDNWYVSSCVTNPADMTQDGAFYLDTYFQAQWFLNTKVTGCKGYSYFFKGSPESLSTNQLNFVFNPNSDAAPLPENRDLPHKAGTAYFGYVGSTQIAGPASWTAGWGMPAINFSEYSQSNTARGFQVPVNRAGGVGVSDNGVQNNVEAIEAVGYDGLGESALTIGPKANKGRYKGIKAQQLKHAVIDQSADSAGYTLDDLAYTAISSLPLVGMAGNTNEATVKTIRNVTNLDSGPAIVAASSMLNLPDRGETFFINSAGTINGIVPTYIGRRVTLILTTPGTVVADVGSAAAGTGALYLSPAGNVTTDHNRWRMTFEWKGDFWFEVARVH